MKGIKRIAMLVAVMLVALSMVAVLASCGGDDTTGSSDDSTSTTSSTTTPTTGSTGGGDGVEDNPNLVKVTVVDQNNKPIKGATVQICQGETCFAKPIVTGNDGVGTREYSSLGSERLKAKIQAINGNEDYLVPGEMGYVYFGEGEREITIKVRKVIVNVFDQNDKAVEGAAIQLYQGEHAFKDLIYTDADGIAYAFIAISGEDIGAQVTEILSGSGYELDNEIVYFDPGMYEATVLVSKLTTYSVKITTMLGKPIYNAKVELFDVAKNRKQKTAYTDESGIARFENMDPNEYYVKVTIESPAFKIITEASDGKYMFGNSYTLNIDVIELEKITYTVNAPESLNGYEVLVFDDRFDFVHEFLVIENGKVTFEASNGNYVVVVITQSSEYIKPVIFLKNDSAVAEVTVENAVAGADANHPIYLIGNNGIAILPNEPMWY